MPSPLPRQRRVWRPWSVVSDVRPPRPRRMRPQQTAISRQNRQHRRPWRLVRAFVLLRLPEKHHLQPFSTILVWTDPNSESC
ncbi:hypothetical protein E2C01_083825 [Portunus trituberculatus]|uniref:Uncharacterized protein n=1 Tax=Portunus trituberculatus TaxID=210409 RepID=A0A5B7ITH4_PORTR|nr:hypothetical protein [Portunus trituberculatus]